MGCIWDPYRYSSWGFTHHQKNTSRMLVRHQKVPAGRQDISRIADKHVRNPFFLMVPYVQHMGVSIVMGVPPVIIHFRFGFSMNKA